MFDSEQEVIFSWARQMCDKTGTCPGFERQRRSGIQLGRRAVEVAFAGGPPSQNDRPWTAQPLPLWSVSLNCSLPVNGPNLNWLTLKLMVFPAALSVTLRCRLPENRVTFNVV